MNCVQKSSPDCKSDTLRSVSPPIDASRYNSSPVLSLLPALERTYFLDRVHTILTNRVGKVNGDATEKCDGDGGKLCYNFRAS